ncbi:hypothetical protein [Paenibacillus sp. GCM10012303]|uniref:hypothetical protein n=1 Tax=Paenibacillus sp. GCM10012303 TaxID=3317340 RepID=UPI0036231B8D
MNTDAGVVIPANATVDPEIIAVKAMVTESIDLLIFDTDLASIISTPFIIFGTSDNRDLLE